ncbi:MAG: hypothetical protein KDD43_02300 [Bdellovibrionales bacterium]|nr:hypothetical protein [Bdellovibrionales bacterium]
MNILNGPWPRLFTAVLVAGFATTTLTGCDEDVVAGAAVGGVIGAVVGGIISDGYRDDDYRYRNPRYYSNEGTPTEAFANDSELLSQRFNISLQSAQFILTHVESAQQGNTQALQQIGLQQNDLADIAQLKMPAQQTVTQVAQRVEVDQRQAQEILQAVIDQAQVQFQDVRSPLWQACMSADKWQTPQNFYCKDTFWNGCSPSTGASSCIPLQ